MRRTVRKLSKNLIILVFLGITVLATFYLYLTYRSLSAPVDASSSATTTFIVAKGATTPEIAQSLHTQGLIRSVFGFRLLVKVKGLAPQFQAGIYDLSPRMSSMEIASSLTRGRSDDIRLTIPEGLRLEEIARKVSTTLPISEKDFLEASSGLEGKLFPDTYNFAKSDTSEDVIKVMTATFDSKTSGLNLTKEDIILASLIERETRGNDEKPVVAGILKKRLDAGWPLQLDATVQYALGNSKEWWPVTTILDRQRPSLYNTYLHQGLPPGPICNPGLDSLSAAVKPQASDYWFYLHDRSGTIRYAKTAEEHEQNISKYIR